MKSKVLKVSPEDNIIVALDDYQKGDILIYDDKEYTLIEDVPLKHKFAAIDFAPGDRITMYGVTVGQAKQSILAGSRISTDNVGHWTDSYQIENRTISWTPPDISRFEGRTFNGYHRNDGKVGTRNYWLIIPLVFCENRNVKLIEEVLLKKLGYAISQEDRINIDKLIQAYQNGTPPAQMDDINILSSTESSTRKRIFPNVDGIKFLTHDGGCGGTRQDSETLCRLLASYIMHANVAGATVLSLGCQHAQIPLLQKILSEAGPAGKKPVFYLEQQKSKSEPEFISDAIKKTFTGLIEANEISRKPAPLSVLSLGLECGGSDGFSGLSANPALGYTSDLLVALGGTTILSEFPELNGVEQELINRCTTKESAQKFAQIMKDYSARAEADGSGFHMNPSPGNIRDGLITDAMKSAGAANKGGTSPIEGVLDYTEVAQKRGLHLLCTPGNDVESTTGLAGAGANLIVFTTGLGTPTGNAITPTVKMSTNNQLALRMSDIIDINAGTIITGEDDLQSKGEELLELLIKVANGQMTKAEELGQDDFIPWKRGVSL